MKLALTQPYIHTCKHTYVHTSANREEKGKRERAKRRESGAWLGEVTNNKYTHTSKNVGEKTE